MKKITLLCAHFAMILRLKSMLKHAKKGLNAYAEKARKLFFRLQRTVPAHVLKKMIGPAALLMLMATSQRTEAQYFKPPLLNPFGIQSAYYNAFPAFVDIDDDGDLDLFVGEYYYGNFNFYENTGSPNAPILQPSGQNPFGLTPINDYLAAPEFVDLDNDGDYDLMAGGYNYGALLYYENVGTASAPQFSAPLHNPFGIYMDSTNFYSFPSFGDLDNDGDFDMIIGKDYADFKYFENTGNASQPMFALPLINPFGLTMLNGPYSYPEFTDIDGDGDLDLISGGQYYGNSEAMFAFFENTGTPSSPSFAQPVFNPFNLQSTQYYNMPAVADIDGDGDMDIFTGEDYGNIKYFENTVLGIAENHAPEPIGIYPNPVLEKCLIRLPVPPTESGWITINDICGNTLGSVRLKKGCSSLVFLPRKQHLAPGIYQLNWSDPQGSFTARLMVAE